MSTPFGALIRNLRKRQRELTDREDAIMGRCLKQHTRTSVEDLAKETLQECRETPTTLETSEVVGANSTLIKTFFEVFAKGGEGDREKRFTLSFDAIENCHQISICASATELAQVLGEILPERCQAFHHGFLLGSS